MNTTAQRWVGVVIVCWASTLAAASGCNEGTDASVGSFTQELIQYGLNNHVCDEAEGTPATCPTDKVTTCTGDCVKPRLVGQSCVNLACHSKSVCAEDVDGTGRASTSCVYDGSSWKCRPFDATSNPGMALFNECDPSDTWHPCPADSWCKDVGTCSNVTLGSTDHMCASYQLQGHLCDGGFTGSGCALCAPGTDCHSENTGYAGFSGRCRKACTTADDCPCEDDGEQDHVCHTDGYCHECRDEGEACDDNYVCCDSATLDCEVTCCRKIGQPCSDDGDCCTGANPKQICYGGDCAPCRDNYDSCDEDSDCCEGACLGGTCRPDCELMIGQQCDVPGTEGPCKTSGVITGCDANYDPICTQQIFPAGFESCNNVDDDCDGAIDNDVVFQSPTCTATPGECQAGFSTQGEKKCEGGVAICEATPYEHYCNACGYQGSNNCGQCTGDNCTVGGCAPNLVCNQTTLECNPVSTTTSACNPEGAGYTPKCWKFDDVGTGETACCGECLP